MTPTEPKPQYFVVAVVGGVEGNSLYVCDKNREPAYRVAGPKPWGGGRVLRLWEVKVSELLREIEQHSYEKPDT